MIDLRKAAEMALGTLIKSQPLTHSSNSIQEFMETIRILRQALAQHEHPLDIYERAYFAGKQDGIDETIALLKVKNT